LAKKITAEIISIGNEILAGWTLNTNAHWLAEKLYEIGLPVAWMTTIADSEIEIKSALQVASNRADVILCTGGLGPTPDDITKKAISQFFDSDLILDEATLNHVLKLFESRHIAMPEINRHQALVPKSAKLIFNSLGTAPGLCFEKKDQLFFFLPGVPMEMKQMMTSTVIKNIKHYFNLGALKTFILRTTGIPESRLFEKLESLLSRYTAVPVSFLPKITGVDIKINVSRDQDELYQNAIDLISQIRYTIRRYIYTEDEREHQEITGEILRQKKLTLAIAESFTGGLISDWITDIPGSSDYFLGSIVSYSNESKIKELGVSPNTIITYGAVSRQTALEMALGIQKLFQSDCAISSTGIAGPGGATEEKPVGLCFLAVVYQKKTMVKEFTFGTGRRNNKKRGAIAGLESLRRMLLDLR
jgi:nicotinamide-nucleotide amidase